MAPPCRRDLLATLGSAVALGSAGCLGGGSESPRYRLSAGNVPGSLAEAFRWETRGPFPDADRDLLARLLDEGSVTTTGFALFPPGWDRPQYAERDDTYYELAVAEAGSVSRERWIFWFDLLEGEPPGDAEVYTSSLGTGESTDLREAYGLSDLDVRVVEDAEGELPREGEDFHDPEDDPPGRRGHTFVRRDADETDLVPEPPFTHVAFEMGDETRYGEAVAERATVELTQYEHTARKVAESADGFASYLRETYLEATFDRGALPEAQREILDRITRGGGRYQEHAPLSDALQAVLERLGLADVETPESDSVGFSNEVYFRYEGSNYRAQLEIFR